MLNDTSLINGFNNIHFDSVSEWAHVEGNTPSKRMDLIRNIQDSTRNSKKIFSLGLLEKKRK